MSKPFVEIPYALFSGRFTDPIPLPKSFTYEDREYIHETKCKDRVIFFRLVLILSSARAIDAIQPTNDGQAGDSDPKGKVGYGKPTEDP